jgi:NitT/TauT family transport system ATP-binding protein
VASKIKISLRNVGKSFVGTQGERIEALRDVSFDVEDLYADDGRDIGEFRVLLGPSGCGKSTILRLVAGLEHPDKGEVLFNGVKVDGPGRERGMVFQKYTSFPWLTVERNIAYGLRLAGTPANEEKEIVSHLIEAVGLSGFERAYPETLSGGMQQRVAIARTLAVRPQVVLMDEPFGALDAQTRLEMQQLLLKVWEETASTVLFVTHDVGEALFLADAIFVMSARPGTVLEEIRVPFGRPRDERVKQSREFREMEERLLTALRGAPGHGSVRVSV